MHRYYISKILPFSILIIAFITIQRFASISLGHLAFWWLIQASVLTIFLRAIFIYFDPKNKPTIVLVKWYLIWNLFCLVRGMFVAELYWDWKALIGNGMALLLPLVAYATTNKDSVQSMLSAYIKFAIPIYIVMLPFLPVGAIAAYMYPVCFLMLFFPSLTLRWKIVILTAMFLGLLIEPGTRSFLVKYGIPLLLIIIYYSGLIGFSLKFLETIRNVILLLPWLLFLLAVSGLFNVFKINEYIKGNYEAKVQTADGKIIHQNIVEDSRTFLYEENLLSAKKYNYWLIGRTPARGHESAWFAHEDVTKRGERYLDEVGILNIFKWTGIIGVLLYFLIFYWTSYLAINHSNNIYCKLIGLFISLRWVLCWVEDVSAYDLNYFMIWLMIGVCLSKSFRIMSDSEVKLWVRAIFDKNYLAAYRYYTINYKLI